MQVVEREETKKELLLTVLFYVKSNDCDTSVSPEKNGGDPGNLFVLL